MKATREGHRIRSHSFLPVSQEMLRQNLGASWSEGCHAFVAHWAGLRGSGLMPTTEDFLDSPSFRFAPHLYIVELIGEVALVRLQGTALDERWKTQLTRRDLHEELPAKLRQRSLTNMRHIITHPCGYLARNAYTTSLGRNVTDDLVQLPLAVQPGRPPRLVCLTLMQREDDMDETVETFRTEALEWLDLGAGKPPKPPLDLLD